MQTINISKKRFESLKKYQIPNYVYNTEGTIYELPIKNKWETQMKLLKRLYLTNGNVFGNKLQTINDDNIPYNSADVTNPFSFILSRTLYYYFIICVIFCK